LDLGCIAGNMVVVVVVVVDNNFVVALDSIKLQRFERPVVH
jgi:hypothetical protein